MSNEFSNLNTGDYLDNFNFIVNNSGLLLIEGLNAEIQYNDGELGFSSGIIEIGTIYPGENSLSSNIELLISSFAQNGSLLNIPVRLFNEDGYNQIEYLYLQIGNIESSIPMGPDDYGYYIIGSEDVETDILPEYDWFEIDPYYGGDGNILFIDSDKAKVNFDKSSIKKIFLKFLRFTH